jgi:hypothetical protein
MADFRVLRAFGAIAYLIGSGEASSRFVGDRVRPYHRSGKNWQREHQGFAPAAGLTTSG